MRPLPSGKRRRTAVDGQLVVSGMVEAAGKRYVIDDLLRVMVQLRDPKDGCPWDLEQSFATIAPYTIEEAYEVADAIAREDLDALKDELGDLLLQVVYHAQMASEQVRFDFDDVVQAITEKMIRRHPHVFADVALRERFLATPIWDRIKTEEKAARGKREQSLLDDVPMELPALTRAVKLQKRAGKVVFDWPSLDPVLAKLVEEVVELKQAVATGAAEPTPAARDAVRQEFGDLLFVMANIARHLHVDPEAALREANAKFTRRFRKIEDALAREGRKPEDTTLEEMDRLWDAAKAEERK
jgi:nucleoside triphosphate diphosphatase